MAKRTWNRAAVAVGLSLVVIALTGRPSWADEAFARVTGASQGLIPGDRPAVAGIPGSADAIQVFGTAFGLSVPPGTPGGSGGAPTASPFSFVKRFDRASPKLLLAAFMGESLDVEIVWFMDVAGTPKQTFSIRLGNAFITNIGASASLASNDADGFEQVSLAFSKITFIAPNVDAKGSVGSPISVCLDLVKLSKC